jgi:hypothetical protein
MGRLFFPIFIVILSLALWRAKRTRPLDSSLTLRVIRFGAVGLNVLAGLLQVNVDIHNLIHGLPTEQSIWIRATEIAPALALVVLLWAPRSAPNSAVTDNHFEPHKG